MGALIRLGHRTCGSRCYNAKRPKCSCICEGSNHGRGREEAEKNTSQHAEEFTQVGAVVKVLLPGLEV